MTSDMGRAAQRPSSLRGEWKRSPSSLPVLQDVVRLFESLDLLRALRHSLLVGLLARHAHGVQLLQLGKRARMALLGGLQVVRKGYEPVLDGRHLALLRRHSALLGQRVRLILRLEAHESLQRIRFLLRHRLAGALEIRQDDIEHADNALGGLLATLVILIEDPRREVGNSLARAIRIRRHKRALLDKGCIPVEFLEDLDGLHHRLLACTSLGHGLVVLPALSLAQLCGLQHRLLVLCNLLAQRGDLLHELCLVGFLASDLRLQPFDLGLLGVPLLDGLLHLIITERLLRPLRICLGLQTRHQVLDDLTHLHEVVLAETNLERGHGQDRALQIPR
mmetsp:Transcript_41934/g.106651  ORF Transcript_41934/g.106651 Transcript_41934/m.106651 type:complete len:335 (+) Transcript_41934:3-1007(+)